MFFKHVFVALLHWITFTDGNKRYFDPIVEGSQRIEVSATCDYNNIVFDLHCSDSFTGLIHPVSIPHYPTCVARYINVGRFVRYTLPIDGCNTKNFRQDDGSVIFYNTVIIMSMNPKIYLPYRVFQMYCLYMVEETKVFYNIRFHNLYAIENRASGDLPMIFMEFYKDHPEENAKAQIIHRINAGETVYLSIWVDSFNIYAIRVVNCFVVNDDDLGVVSLMENGCPINDLIQPFIYNRNQTRATALLKAVKFSKIKDSNYRCEVQICVDNSDLCDLSKTCRTDELLDKTLTRARRNVNDYAQDIFNLARSNFSDSMLKTEILNQLYFFQKYLKVDENKTLFERMATGNMPFKLESCFYLPDLVSFIAVSSIPVMILTTLVIMFVHPMFDVTRRFIRFFRL